ncbi:Mre11 DNA-binding presumed domain-containing protein [Apodospora peruviana]|uniref:Double-strand break repair protein n=1 Tax=Apodospora peruviana TaxID=516989 RepID=A0AAE0HX31_9PEZI|nr:Mre11 DNA-binding presumed domain-containing protein [Apodospora peruviana]
MPEFGEEDTIRILVATDNHVGFEERDPIRKDDSWRTFDEIMQLARKRDVDMVLLGGDLFHENKPSRKSMYQVMRALRKNCLGLKPCELEFLSDAAEVFEGAFTHVNYMDPDINISIPVFSIHGNHDDPSGDGHYCSLDLLQVAGLVNYFGRVPEADNIHVKPVLLQKGRTKLALYGLSNVRDERMHRTFRDNKVRFYRPNIQKTDFFNLLTVHQNHYAHTPTSYLAENMLPDFMDLVVWGHEHECLIDPQRNPETGFHVMQPGSSVATSLVPGEAVTKQVAILNITGKDFEVEKIPLRTVRPFVTREIFLATDKRFKGLEKKQENRADITKRLMLIVEEMIEEANDAWLSIHGDPGGDVSDDDDDDGPPLPLIRLKVEYTAPEGSTFEVENPQRFSNRFTGKVANQNDVVYFYRKKTAARKAIDKKNLPEGVAEALESGGADTVKVDTLVNEFFAQQSLKILPQAPFGDAVNQFVSKDDKHAVEMFVMDSLSTQVKGLLQLDDEKITDDLDTHIEDFRKVMEKSFVSGQQKQAQRKRRFREKPNGWDSDMDGHWLAQPEALEQVPPSPEPAKAAPRGRGRAAPQPVLSDEDDDPFGDEPSAVPAKAPTKRAAAASKTAAAKKAAPAKRAAPARKAAAPKKAAPARGGRKKANPFPDSDEEEEEEDVIMEDDDDDEPPPKPTRATRGTTARGAARGKQTTLNFSQSQKKSTQQKAIEISDDDISDGDDAFESMPAAATRNRRL